MKAEEAKRITGETSGKVQVGVLKIVLGKILEAAQNGHDTVTYYVPSSTLNHVLKELKNKGYKVVCPDADLTTTVYEIIISWK